MICALELPNPFNRASLMPVDPSQLDRIVSGIKKQYGAESVRKACEYPNPERISTGSLELDLITRGGFPIGRMIHQYGGKGSGKTLISMKVIANAQAMGQECVYYDAEKQFNAEWAKKQGVNVDKLLVIEENVIEDLATKIESLLGGAHLHVIDSIPATVSLDELAAASDEWRPGIGARAWGKALRRIQQNFDSKQNTLIMINHVGMVFGKYNGGEEPKGAKFIEYLSSLSLEFRKSSWLFRGKDESLKKDGESEEAISGDKTPGGIELQIRVQKSRVSPPLQAARLRIDFSDGSIDDTWSLVKASQLYGLVEKSSPGWYVMDGKKVRETSIREEIDTNASFRKTVIEEIEKRAR